jgi:hypothetical protein
VQDFLQKMKEAPMDVRRLSAGMAIPPNKLGPAVRTGAGTVPVPLARASLN